MYKFEEESGTTVQKMIKWLNSKSSSEAFDFKEVRNLAFFYFSCLKPVDKTKPALSFDTFFDIVDEDTDLFEEISNHVVKQMEEKKEQPS